MRWPNQEIYDPGWLWENSVINKERSNTLNANSPPIHLLDSNIIKEDTQNSDYSMSLSEEGFIYAYCQTFSEKANPRENSGIYSTTESSLSKSQESSNTDRYCTPFSRSRTFSNLPSELCTNLTWSQKVNTHKPKVLKYIRNFSQSFWKFEKLTVNNDSDSDVIFLKAEHELDGQTYILKRRKLFIENDEEIKDHQAYKEILSLNSTSLPLNVRYVNSWVELDQDFTNDELKCYQEDGINVILYISKWGISKI